MEQNEALQKIFQTLQSALDGGTEAVPVQNADAVQDLNTQLDKLRRQSTEERAD